MPTSERYAELQLYFGICPSDGIGEGIFDLESRNRRVLEFNGRALTTVQRYINPWKDWGVKIGGLDPLVRNEQEAQLLIEHAKQSLPNAQGSLRLIDSMHGSIRFRRSILFKGAAPDQADEIVEAMMRSGFQPEDTDRERMLQWYRGYYSGEELEAKLAEVGLGPDRIWRENLKFYH